MGLLRRLLDTDAVVEHIKVNVLPNEQLTSSGKQISSKLETKQEKL